MGSVRDYHFALEGFCPPKHCCPPHKTKGEEIIPSAAELPGVTKVILLYLSQC